MSFLTRHLPSESAVHEGGPVAVVLLGLGLHPLLYFHVDRKLDELGILAGGFLKLGEIADLTLRVVMGVGKGIKVVFGEAFVQLRMAKWV